MRLVILLTLGVSLSLAVHDFVLESANNDFSGFKVTLFNAVLEHIFKLISISGLQNPSN